MAPFARSLPALATAAHLADTVHFTGHREDMPLWLAAADIVLLPSRVEGRPLALLEAHAAGRPVVATRVGGVGEIVVDGQTGLLVPPRDPAQLATAIVHLLTDDATREVMGRASRIRAIAHFDHRRAIRRLGGSLEPLARRGRPARAPAGKHRRRSSDEQPARRPAGTRCGQPVGLSAMNDSSLRPATAASHSNPR
jgi:hypothetical protein